MLRVWLFLCALASLGLGLHMARPWDGNGAGSHLALAGFLLFAISPCIAMAWLAGLYAGMVTGASYTMDGGWTAR